MSQGPRSAGKQASKRAQGKKNSRGTTNKESLGTLLNWLLSDGSIFAKLKLHGNTSWIPQQMVVLALCWAWSESRNLTDGFREAVTCCQTILGTSPVVSYHGFMKATVRWTTPFMAVLWPLLQELMEQVGGKYWRIGKWVLIAFDGSRSTAPRTKANEKAFCAPNYGKGKRAKYGKKKSKGMRRKRNQQNKPQPQQPQAWITLLWHMGLRLPWMWRLGPSNSSERGHVLEMLNTSKFPKNTLFCGDAGFIGYPLWSAILNSGNHFLVRVGANASLLMEQGINNWQKGGLVMCWPQAMIQAGQAPLRLRLVKIRIGKTKVWVLTSVLNEADLSPQQMIQFYKMRWGIEIEFRGLKQTLDRAVLRSRNDQRLLVELDWSIMAMAIAELFAIKEQLSNTQAGPNKDQTPRDPAKRSLANTMRAIRHSLRNLNEIPPSGQDLPTLLRLAVTDSYRRNVPKRARYRPPNPDKKPLGDPKLRKISSKEKEKLNRI